MWVSCMSCGEESIYHVRDPIDFICSVCGGSAFFIEDLSYNTFRKIIHGYTKIDSARIGRVVQRPEN